MTARQAVADALFAVASGALAPVRLRRRRELAASSTAVRRILVLTPEFGVGNLVLLSGLLANVRRLYPQAHVTLAVPALERARSIIGDELVDEVLPFDSRSRWRVLRFAWRELRPRRFDLGFVTFFLATLRASVLLLIAGCRYRVTFAPSERHGLLNTFTCIDRGGHELDRHLQLLAFSPRPTERATHLTPTPRAARWASATLRHLGFDGRARIVGVHPGCEAANAQKRWPAERFGEVVRRLLASGDTGVLLFLGPGEADLLPTMGLPHSSLIHVVREESLAHVIALVARCDAFLSNDSGLMHVAAALSVPVAAVFGPTTLQKNAPVGRATILEKDVWCRPCWVGPPLTCHRDRRYCLEEVGVDEVFDATRALLRSGRPTVARSSAR
jgi:heptosyltransferase-2